MLDINRCRECNTPIMKRRVKFGNKWLEMPCCECEAAKIEARYRKTTTEKQVKQE